MHACITLQIKHFLNKKKKNKKKVLRKHYQSNSCLDMMKLWMVLMKNAEYVIYRLSTDGIRPLEIRLPICCFPSMSYIPQNGPILVNPSPPFTKY